MADYHGKELAHEMLRWGFTRRQMLKMGIGLGLSATSLTTLFTACGGGRSGGQATESPVADAAKEGPPSEPVRFSYMRPTWGPATYTKGGAYEQELFERGNVQIDVQIIPVIDYDTKVNTVLASGDIPDVIWGSGPMSGTWKDAQDQGAFLKINEYLDKYPAVKDAVPSSVWDKLKDEQGDIYFIPNLIYPIVPFFLFYRQDLFEQADIAEPTTIEEFVAALEQVKEAYPNQVPFSMGYEWHAKDLSTSFDFTKFGWEPSDEDPNMLMPWHTKEKEIDFYFWLQDLHKRRLLDPEYRVNPEPNFSTDNFNAGRVVVATENWLVYPDMVTKLRNTEPDAKVGVISPLGERAGTRSVFPVDRGFYISARMEDPDGFFQFLNWTLTDGSDFRRWGVEGKTYNVVDGQKVPIPDAEREADYKNPQIEPLRFLDPFEEKLDWDMMQLSFEGAGLGDQFEYIKGKFEEYAANDYPDYRNPTVLSPTEVSSGTRLWSDHMEQVVESAIINHNVKKEDWLNAVEQWKAAGGSEIIEEVNELQEDKSKPNYLE